jgi:hypothetical protein
LVGEELGLPCSDEGPSGDAAIVGSEGTADLWCLPPPACWLPPPPSESTPLLVLAPLPTPPADEEVRNREEAEREPADSEERSTEFAASSMPKYRSIDVVFSRRFFELPPSALGAVSHSEAKRKLSEEASRRPLFA